MEYQLAQHTMAGARPENQDRIATATRENSLLMVLADGLGGHAGGAMAAETLVETVIKSYQKIKQPIITSPAAFLSLNILHAHRMINARAKAANQPLTARTTCVLCLVQNGYAYWAHVGDSRLYHFRNDIMRTRTLDHSTTEQLRQDGLIDENESHRSNKIKDYLLKCVGGPNRPRVSLGEETRLLPGDSILLCSDGVWQAFTAEELGHYLRPDSFEESVEEMLLNAETRMKEACDNLSIIALHWEDSITTQKPLQPGPASEIDQDFLWQEAKRAALKRRIANQRNKGRPAKKTSRELEKNDEKHSIQTTIDELEAFIKDLEKRV